MSGPRRSRNDPAAMIETENSVWDVYNNLADIRDSELIKDWNDSLNFLLIFAAIFSAVLTALIVESMNLLQENPQDTTNAILLYMSSQLANNTMPAYQSSEFQVPQYAVVVNALLFASLCCSLIAALAAVLALQWVNEYDARIDTVDSEKRAAIRHFRFVGVGTWKMAEIIAFLPLLLHSSVFLFFAGIIAWLRNVHLLISWICVTGTAITVMFYIITTTLAATFGSSPFRSPMARVFRYVQFTVAWYATDVWWIPLHWTALYVRVSNWHWDLAELRDTKSLEAEHANNSTGNLDVLIWTVDHVELTIQSTHRLLQMLKHAIPPYSGRQGQSPRIPALDEREMWQKILRTISQTYIHKAAVQEFSSADLEAVRLLFSSCGASLFKWPAYVSPYLELINWDYWPSTLKLIGPISFDGILRTNQLEFLMAIFNAMWLKNSEQAAQQLVATIQSVAVPTTPQEEQILSYSIDCLSTFLWTHGTGDKYLQAANSLAEMIAVPPGRLFTKLQAAGTIELTLSAIYSVAFNHSTQGARQYWASGHRLYLASELGDKSAVVRVLHSAFTSRIASEVAHATDVNAAYESLQLLCTLMAYTPFETVWGANAALVSGFIENMSIMGPWDGKDNIYPALTSLVWLPKLNKIPRIHEYLEVILSCRQRFPSLKPAWRNWDSDIHNRRLLYHVLEEDIHWMDRLKSDRQIVEVFQAFDELLGHDYSAAQHLVLVQLLIDDLSDKDVATDDNYYTNERKASLKTLKDPVLRLIGARAAGIAYSGPLPPLGGDGRRNESWVEALGYRCGHFEVVDAELDKGFIVAILSHPNPALYSVLLRSSSRNVTLQSRLNEPSDTNATLLLHTVARTASWFPEYVTPLNAAKIVGLLRTTSHLNPLVLPLFAFLVSFLSTTEELKVITTTVQKTLSNGDPYLGQREANEIYSAFGGILQDPPQWMQALRSSNINLWREVSESIRGILDIIRTQEDSARAVIRWNGRAPPVPAQGEGDLRIYSSLREVSSQEKGAGNQDHDHIWLERQYSCAASWDI